VGNLGGVFLGVDRLVHQFIWVVNLAGSAVR
jgi:hypothetical protein